MYKISLREILPHKFWKPSTLSHFHVFIVLIEMMLVAKRYIHQIHHMMHLKLIARDTVRITICTFH